MEYQVSAYGISNTTGKESELQVRNFKVAAEDKTRLVNIRAPSAFRVYADRPLMFKARFLDCKDKKGGGKGKGKGKGKAKARNDNTTRGRNKSKKDRAEEKYRVSHLILIFY